MGPDGGCARGAGCEAGGTARGLSAPARCARAGGLGSASSSGGGSGRDPGAGAPRSPGADERGLEDPHPSTPPSAPPPPPPPLPLPLGPANPASSPKACKGGGARERSQWLKRSSRICTQNLAAPQHLSAPSPSPAVARASARAPHACGFGAAPAACWAPLLHLPRCQPCGRHGGRPWLPAVHTTTRRRRDRQAPAAPQAVRGVCVYLDCSCPSNFLCTARFAPAGLHRRPSRLARVQWRPWLQVCCSRSAPWRTVRLPKRCQSTPLLCVGAPSGRDGR